MGIRSLSPMVRRELENLDKDADSRKSAMKALKSYVKDLDSKAIPLFLAQVSETKETGSSGEYTISLYEVLARVHGHKIVPQIDNIMTTIIKTLTSSAGSFALHQACSKVVPAIARYGMDPTTPEDKKRHIIHSLCKPLSDCLLGSHESLSSGAALCLKALVECDNWRFASNGMVNEVCQRVAGALDKHLQTNSHMALVMSLAKHNSLTVEAYARLLIRTGLQILNEDANSQKRLSAIHMVSSLMKCLDHKSISSELELIIKVMENCQSDQMAYVSGAAFEALQTARKICTEKSSKFEKDMVSVTGSNFDRRGNLRRRNLSDSGDQSPLTASPESQTINSFCGHDSFFDSPISTNQTSPDFAYDRRSVNRKLWSRCENGVLDVSLKDGIFSEVTRRSAMGSSEHDGFSDFSGDYTDGFVGFCQTSSRNRVARSATPSPQRSRSLINVDSVKIFATPRKLIHSLQDQNEESSDSDKPNRRFRSPSSQYEMTPTSKYKQNGVHQMRGLEINGKGKSPTGSEALRGSSESVSSTQDIPAEDTTKPSPKLELPRVDGLKGYWKPTRNTLGILFVIFATILCFMLIDDQGEGYNLVPT
ncbi:protein SINE1 [Coffea eugenioides]|uniref:protein SINE1 n=1 Tax=Coffea eugenioides TaxID=49369 RepID=UPI000F60B02C|nr:protein SINE1 [Coffea eugenioides]XP_027177415.1 protein SINE1 [Coffea eugenioides]